ncbi:TonB-dependent receptor domain-containing protein [Phenylobacterium sp.]|uniref:TonB-dependent receptor domain-containing protein n=1 Tax=Phenylobacterium sp. TaxID=1871053 RepID=UPI002731F6B1|nr:TonB-dependent receptor [Phenylobacterium sp.]MDP2213444.1 TonB-dependent receptor [Phenylobacterium sp.]
MSYQTIRGRLLATTMLGAAMAAALSAAPAVAQTTDATQIQEIIVTGSRIRRVDTETAAPVLTVDQQSFTDRGVVQVGDLMNQISSNIPNYPIAAGSGTAAGAGQQFPNLFGLGPGRTLTLVNGRRFVASSNGLAGSSVDTNMIPLGLLDRVEVVQGGGAAVYGSDAIAGVINYVLKTNFEGIELDAQTGISSRSDYPVHALRGTFGKNFLDARGNVALNLEWSQNDSLLDYDRPRSNLGRITVPNPANTSNTDGIPSVKEIFDARFWEFNPNGVIFTTPAPVPGFLLGQQFTSAGGIAAYNPGSIQGVPFASGGEGQTYRELAALRTGVERFSANAIGHFDLTDRVRLTGELLYGRTEGTDPYAAQSSYTVLNNAASGAGVITFTRTNPFLSPATVAQLTALRPAFGAGAPLFLSKWFDDLLPTREGSQVTESYRALAGLEGDFDFAERNFYWSATASRGVTEGRQEAWGVDTARFNNAINAVRNSAGTIVCAINADASTANDDAACAPINPFGNGNVSPEARAYATVQTGQEFYNVQDNFLATVGGDLFTLPAGPAKFSLAYEYRRESAKFVPLEASQRGLTGSRVPTVATRGEYDTNEYSAELLVPILGGDVTLPFARSVEFEGAFRRVKNSLAGSEDVWGAGLRWEVFDGLTLRGSRSRNFRAPTLEQLLAPSRTALASVGQDPCDADRISGGPAPATRLANCQALFAANPSYGPLATFQNPAENFAAALVTTGGNPDLRNEISDTTTIGFIFQPTFAPGLTIVVDRIEVDLTDGLSPFTPQNFMETCYDSSPQPADICSRFTRDATGATATAQTTTFNAGEVTYRGETYFVGYTFAPGRFFGDADWGNLDLSIEATHTAKLETSVTGFDRSRLEGTVANPDWTTRFDARHVRGPVRLTYSMIYLPEVKATPTATIENNPNPIIERNIRHSVSGQYDFGKYTVRAGVINLTDEEPSYPTRNYGDILGRQYYVGLNARF